MQVPIQNQNDVDQVIELMDRNLLRNLRIMLVEKVSLADLCLSAMNCAFCSISCIVKPLLFILSLATLKMC